MVLAFFLTFLLLIVALLLLAAFAIFPEETRRLLGSQIERLTHKPRGTSDDNPYLR